MSKRHLAELIYDSPDKCTGGGLDYFSDVLVSYARPFAAKEKLPAGVVTLTLCRASFILAQEAIATRGFYRL